MSAPVLPHAPHDHSPCMREALAAADALARRRGLRFTPLRRRVLEIILGSHRPMGAYDILHALSDDAARRKPAPPTVYRALDFLLREGFVHRIDTLNAYIACFAPERRHRTHFLLVPALRLRRRDRVTALDRALERAAADAGFAVERETVEIAGLCAACAENARRAFHAAPDSVIG